MRSSSRRPSHLYWSMLPLRIRRVPASRRSPKCARSPKNTRTSTSLWRKATSATPPTCAGRPASQGAMGVHYFRPDMLGIMAPPDPAPPNPRVNGNGTHTDFRAPAILIYEPQADGSMQLVAVENLVFQASWAAAGHSSPPTFHGVAYDNMKDDPATPTDEAHNFAPHFDRHVWIYRENPNGVFTPFNPAVSCAHHVMETAAAAAQ